MSELFDALNRLDAIVRPFQGVLPPLEGRRAQFSATMKRTVRQLQTELVALDADDVVLELAIADRDLRLDGFPRANAKITSAAVGLAFQSRHGPVRVATGTFDRWQHNLRAITLGMEALRAVDRYGISRRGEQYVGYRELPSGARPAAAAMTRDEALAVIRDLTEDRPGADVDTAVRLALRRTHPDVGGDPEDFLRVSAAKAILQGES